MGATTGLSLSALHLVFTRLLRLENESIACRDTKLNQASQPTVCQMTTR